jgi:azurin
MARTRWSPVVVLVALCSLGVPVCLVAAPDASLLTKPDVDPADRIQALKDAAQSHNTKPLDELLSALDRADATVAPELASLLANWDAGELKAARAKLAPLAIGAKVPAVRRAAFGALLSAGDPTDELWKLADAAPAALPDFLAALAQSYDAERLGASYDRLLALIQNPPAPAAPATRRAAAEAAAMVKGKEAQTFAVLAHLSRMDSDVPAMLAGLRRIPQDKWPKDQLAALAAAAVAHVQKVPPDRRTSDDFLTAYAAARELSALLPEAEAKKAESTLAALGVRSIVIKSVPMEMRFEPDQITAEAGRPVELVLLNPDMMPHNLIVTRPGAMEDVGQAGEAMAGDPKGFDKGFVPDSPKVLHASRLLQPNETQHLAFVAPEKPGEYPYVCTFPGHWRTMNGVMKVTAGKK